MGWWKQNEKGESFAEGGLLWGDGPADVMAAALTAIVEEFEREQGRKPTKDELVAGLRFGLGSVESDPLYSTIDLAAFGDLLTLRHVEEMVERVREVAFPTLVTEGGMPVRIDIEWTGERCDDPWELRAAISELESDLSQYFPGYFFMERPRPKAVVTDVAGD